MGKDIKNGLTIVRLTRSSVGSRFNEIDYFVIENEEKFQFDLRKIRLYSFQRMYDYQFTSYIYIYRRATSQIRQTDLNYRLRSDTVSNDSNSFDLRRTKTSLLKSALPLLSFFSIVPSFPISPSRSIPWKSWKSSLKIDSIISITFDDDTFYYYYYNTSILDRLGQLSQASIHFSTRDYYIHRSHDWIPLHGSLPRNINRRRGGPNAIHYPERKFHFHFSVSQTAGNCYFQLWWTVCSSAFLCRQPTNTQFNSSFSIASDSRKFRSKTHRDVI